MRTIKFRGKRVNNGEWVYGDLMQLSHNAKCMSCAIYSTQVDEVDVATVGQFTGLLDGNGQEIFEGDIMRIPETEFNIEIIGVVDFDRGSYFVRSFFSGTHSSLGWAVRERQPGERRGVVIGNIYDNNELIK